MTLALLCIVERIETGYVAAEQVTSLLDAVVNPRQAHAAPGASSSAAASSREAAPARRAFTPDPPMATAGGGGGEFGSGARSWSGLRRSVRGRRDSGTNATAPSSRAANRLQPPPRPSPTLWERGMLLRFRQGRPAPPRPPVPSGGGELSSRSIGAAGASLLPHGERVGGEGGGGSGRAAPSARPTGFNPRPVPLPTPGRGGLLPPFPPARLAPPSSSMGRGPRFKRRGPRPGIVGRIPARRGGAIRRGRRPGVREPRPGGRGPRPGAGRPGSVR